MMHQIIPLTYFFNISYIFAQTKNISYIS